MLFFVLAIFLLAAKGNPVKRRAPIAINQETVGAWLLGGITHARKCIFQILRRLTMSVGEHTHHPSRRFDWPSLQQYSIAPLCTGNSRD